ncbi:hypothetical protein DSM3645_06629 [Blastopirellula marina DSM 3645]|uniref:Uncharacterized protein n=1 Tax=Blastopirellula marina DSM 3645 TaxID=314230 RepID=A4A155_9BACT|nr:hypothetical protein DSM3645_06629 [Blastopirellula marina DSM 3645]
MFQKLQSLRLHSVNLIEHSLAGFFESVGQLLREFPPLLELIRMNSMGPIPERRGVLLEILPSFSMAHFGGDVYGKQTTIPVTNERPKR